MNGDPKNDWVTYALPPNRSPATNSSSGPIHPVPLNRRTNAVLEHPSQSLEAPEYRLVRSIPSCTDALCWMPTLRVERMLSILEEVNPRRASLSKTVRPEASETVPDRAAKK
jgi:hypothetical protein